MLIFKKKEVNEKNTADILHQRELLEFVDKLTKFGKFYNEFSSRKNPCHIKHSENCAKYYEEKILEFLNKIDTMSDADKKFIYEKLDFSLYRSKKLYYKFRYTFQNHFAKNCAKNYDAIQTIMLFDDSRKSQVLEQTK